MKNDDERAGYYVATISDYPTPVLASTALWKLFQEVRADERRRVCEQIAGMLLPASGEEKP